MIAVMGASGNTGKVVAEELLGRGMKVRAIGRDAGKLQALAARGAETAVGDGSDQGFLARAFAGAESAYTLIPPDFRAQDFRAHQDRIGEATAAALRQSGVKRVVLLSSVGADLPAGTGPIAGLYAQEKRLAGLGVDVLSLRAGYFFENLHASLPVIRHQGVNGSAISPDVKLSMIATRDIGATTPWWTSPASSERRSASPSWPTCNFLTRCSRAPSSRRVCRRTWPGSMSRCLGPSTTGS
jgi:uncharacterized protein YbjT (DUF2867 family)